MAKKTRFEAEVLPLETCLAAINHAFTDKNSSDDWRRELGTSKGDGGRTKRPAIIAGPTPRLLNPIELF